MALERLVFGSPDSAGHSLTWRIEHPSTTRRGIGCEDKFGSFDILRVCESDPWKLGKIPQKMTLARHPEQFVRATREMWYGDRVDRVQGSANSLRERHLG